ncbi:hypothetical protein J4443_03345 [Candidatus Woesearchaeota archaeon]|nr:hypothetical protein [Candidatus Woesearchaeota archaeon]
MRHTFLQPQEIEVFYIIPTLRRYLAMYMKLQGLKQNKIAELLHIEKSAVSQYIKKKRGSKVEFSEGVLNEIAKSVSKIKDEFSLLGEIQRLLRVIRNSGDLCRIHKDISKIPEECEPDKINCFGDEDERNRHAGICY